MPPKKPIKIKVEDLDNEDASGKPDNKAKAENKKKKTSSKRKAAPAKKKAVRIDSPKSKPMEKKKPAKEAEKKAEKAGKSQKIKQDKEIKVDMAPLEAIAEEKKAPKKKEANKEENEIDRLFDKSGAVKDFVREEEKKSEFGKIEIGREEKAEPETAKQLPKTHLKLYKRLAYFFAALTGVIVIAAAYFLVAKVDITLIPNQERISNNMIFDVYDKESGQSSNANSILGIVREIEIENIKDYKASGEEIIGEEAVGKAFIINNYSKNQPLVATTRLLSPDGKLFRLENTVNVPAGGSVEADIYADEPGPEMAVEATKFTIPGLWAGLQDKIFAESKEPVVYRKKIKSYITEEDIENSIRDLKQTMLAEAKQKINGDYKEYGQIIYKIDDNSAKSEIEAEVGDETESFTAKMEAKVIVVAFNEGQAVNLAKNKFMSSLSDSKEMLSFDGDNIIYSLNNYNIEEGSAAINATFEGKVSLKDDYDIIETDKILGLNEDQLNVYLGDLPEIAGFKIKFYPSFIKRVPSINDRINIIIEK